MYDRAVLHMDLDSFFVSVECLKNSDLLGKPLIIGGDGGRGVVSTCSYEARKYGVHSAMPMKMAKRLCPDAIILRGDMEEYSKYSHLVTDVIAEESPAYEKASIDEFYIDLTGMDRHFGCFNWSVHLTDKIYKETGLPISFGLSVNKLVSKIGAGEGKPLGRVSVKSGDEKSYLAPLSTSKIPGVGKETYKKLSFMGVRTIRVLSEIPVKLLEREFGKSGILLSQHANGIDKSPVMPYTEQKSISTETTLSQDTVDIRHLKDLLSAMTDKLAYELRSSQKLTSNVAVKIRYADFNTFTKQRQVAYTSGDRVLQATTLDLFNRLYDRRQMIRLIGVRFSGLVHGNYQISLFEDTESDLRLMEEMDHIRNRWGSGAIMRANHLMPKSKNDKDKF
ncbi:MAG: DNA polymerase IV [Saprospiraceae bacterium]|jgi:DNA polymerase-4|nr:DNA polymerase IV [Saprospiraceae bacterium]HMT76251.1 DNA polymerase IV [Saprospiraceae bacterium]HQU94536.1 DNA polymerase IV [Saprospiraceae bacterium]HQW94593.1 DNA polymerase IV [Saprospiraceae bacterium]